MPERIKQVIIIRKDLNVRKGKMMAQAAHASLKVFFDRGQMYRDEKGPFLQITCTEEMKDWFFSAFTKICLGVPSEEELQKVYDSAIVANLPAALIIDSGATEFNGVPTKTAVAIGPAKEIEIDKITGTLSLL